MRRRKINKGNAPWKWGSIRHRYWDLIADLQEEGRTQKEIANAVNSEIRDDYEDRRTRDLMYIDNQYIGKILRRGEYRIFVNQRKEKNETTD